MFAGSGVNVTPDGRPYLGAAIGSYEYVEKYVNSKVKAWSSSINMLSEIAKSQPHAAFSALTHGLLRKWTCRSRVVPKINHLLVPLDDLLRTNLIPAITGRSPPNDLEYDALALRYGWTPFHLPSKCECGNSFNVEHALSCRKGGFPSLRHNEIRDITASLLTEVCSEVCTEPDLQPVTPDQLDGASANSQDGARLDVSANGVWGCRFQKTYFDV